MRVIPALSAVVKKEKYKKGIAALGGIAIAIITLIITVALAVLLGGVFEAQINTIFTQQGVSTNWTSIASQVFGYGRTGLILLGVGIIVAVFGAILAILKVFRD